MNIEEFMSPEVAEDIRNKLKKALDEINFPHEFIRDRLLTNFTREVCLAKV